MGDKMEKFKGYDISSLLGAVDFAKRNYGTPKNPEPAVLAISKCLEGESVLDIARRIDLKNALKKYGLTITEGQAKIVMGYFFPKGYTEENILLVVRAYNELAKISEEDNLGSYNKMFLAIKKHERDLQEKAPSDIVFDELIDIENYLNGEELHSTLGIAGTLSRIRLDHVRDTNNIFNEVKEDISVINHSCAEMLNSDEDETIIEMYHILYQCLNDLETYQSLLSEEDSGVAKLEMRAVSELKNCLQENISMFGSLINKGAISDECQNLSKENDVDGKIVLEKLNERFDHQWHIYLVHYQDILVHHSSDYVVKNNIYARKLMNALKSTDDKIKAITGESRLQRELLRIEDKYRPVLSRGGIKIPRQVQSGEDE